MSDPPRLLILCDDKDFIDDIKSLLCDDFSSYRKSADRANGLDLFFEYKPHLLLLAFHDVEVNKDYYLELFRARGNRSLPPHQSIVLCKQGDSKLVAELCRRKIFDDYVIMKPMFDSHRLCLSLRLALERVLLIENAGKAARGMSDSGRVASELHSALNQVARDTSDMQQAIGRDYESLAAAVFADIGVSLADPNVRVPAGDVTEIDAPGIAGGENSNRLTQLKSRFDDYRQAVGSKLGHLSDGVDSVCQQYQEIVEGIQRKVVSGSINILVVDDSDLYLDVLRAILEKVGYQVTTASDGVQGLYALARLQPDILFVDFDMPGMDGLELIDQLKHYIPATNHPAIIMITGSKSKDLVQKAVARGVDDYIIKPSSAEIILGKVAALLEKKRS